MIQDLQLVINLAIASTLCSHMRKLVCYFTIVCLFSVEVFKGTAIDFHFLEEN